jgi:murein L,D-transpeptidase YcbB/YkuD
MARHIEYKELGKLLYVLQPPMAEVKVLRSAIVRLNKIIKDTTYREEPILSSKVSVTNKPLLRKLFCLGILDSLNKPLSDKSLQEKVKEGQKLFNLLDDGVLRSTYLQELNVPLTARLKQLSRAINYYRWLYCLTRKQPVVVVNIPAAYMKVYSEGNTIMEMRVIVGKPSTTTPTLASTITEVILYPYWMVPQSIATKELLPAIKRNPGYIDAHGYQVLNRQGRIMDPYSINWLALSSKNFPYLIRQSTGCDNALGLLKLNFHNPYSVYLHDTPSKSLFMLNKRFFSHGCMRMEKPTELAHLVMANNEIAIDTLTEKGCLRNQSPISIPAEVRLPVIVWYNTAGINTAGKIVYFEDVYHKFSSLVKTASNLIIIPAASDSSHFKGNDLPVASYY